jgi:hypothetical protein
MNWKSFAPKEWKIGTLKGLIRRAFVICSNEQFLNKEISFLKNVFGKINGFPSRVIHDTIRSVKLKIEHEVSPPEVNPPEEETVPEVTRSTDEVVKPFICLPYKGKEGEKILSQFRNALTKALPSRVQPQFTYKGKKIGSYFRLKDKVSIEHQSGLVYVFKKGKYVGETKVRFGDRIDQHCHTDKKSAVYKFKVENQVQVSKDDFEILDMGYSNTLNRKLAEALFIKDIKPELNEQVKSYKLNLFN